MTDKDKFYQLAYNIINYRDSVTIEKDRMRFSISKQAWYGGTLDILLTIRHKRIDQSDISLTISSVWYDCIPQGTTLKTINTIIDRINYFFSYSAPCKDERYKLLEGLEYDE